MIRFLSRLALAYAVEQTCERLAPKGTVTVWLDDVAHTVTVRKYNGTRDAAKRIAKVFYPGWVTSLSGSAVSWSSTDKLDGRVIWLGVTDT